MLISHQCKYVITFRNQGMLRSHLSAIRYERRDGPFAADRGTLLVFQVKIRGVESPYVLVRFVPLGCMCQYPVTRSVTKESPVQIRSRTFEYDDPDGVPDYHDSGSRFGTI